MSDAVVTIRDPQSGAEAAILTTLGFNCFRFDVPLDGKTASVLWADPAFAQGDLRPSRSGIPLLFPFPGRIAGMTFDWEGRSYPLEMPDDFGNAIHGFVYTRPWRLVEQSASRAVGQFQASIDAPEVLEKWPADFRITADYEVAGQTLRARYTIENPDQRPLPCGLGAHPYFRIPLSGDDTSQCVVQLPIRERWELKQMLTTGRREPIENARSYQAGQPFDTLKLDDVFTGLVFEGDWCVSRMIDRGSGLQTVVRFDRLFRDCVVFTPPHRQAICIEPYTCPPDPFRLAKQGTSDVGLIVLGPGESRTGVMEIEVQPTS